MRTHSSLLVLSVAMLASLNLKADESSPHAKILLPERDFFAAAIETGKGRWLRFHPRPMLTLEKEPNIEARQCIVQTAFGDLKLKMLINRWRNGNCHRWVAAEIPEAVDAVISADYYRTQPPKGEDEACTLDLWLRKAEELRYENLRVASNGDVHWLDGQAKQECEIVERDTKTNGARLLAKEVRQETDGEVPFPWREADGEVPFPWRVSW